MRPLTLTVAAMCAAATGAACGSGAIARDGAALPAGPAPAPPGPGAAMPRAGDATWEAWRHGDEVILTPHRFADAVAPLVAHRRSLGRNVTQVDIEPLLARGARGADDPKALLEAVSGLAVRAAGKLRYVLLVGDFDEVPTFFLGKLAYEHHSLGEHQNPHAITWAEHGAFPSDDPYADASAPRLAVGRVPARSVQEVDAFVRKLVAYETASLDHPGADPTWRRRVTLYAGDPALGPTADAVVQTVATGILDDEMSYDYDLRLTFVQERSPYAYGYDALERKFMGDLDDGAIVAAYVGHGSVTRFAPAEYRGRRYEVGTADDAAALRIAAGKPVFFSIACDTGAFDRPDGLPSLAERMILNVDGPVAVFAASRESHPYPNALYGQAVIEHFVNERPPTVGAGILAVKDGMAKGSIPVAELLLGDDVAALKAEHVKLYNLFGDPATTLRYPAPLTVATSAGAVPEGAPFDVDVTSPSVAEGHVHVTLETRRSTMKQPMFDSSSLAQMSESEAFAAMARNNALANDKVVAAVDVELHAARAHATLRAPARAGDYVVKAFASGADAAAGHAELHVGAAR
jgi:Peptidase family C25